MAQSPEAPAYYSGAISNGKSIRKPISPSQWLPCPLDTDPIVGDDRFTHSHAGFCTLQRRQHISFNLHRQSPRCICGPY